MDVKKKNDGFLLMPCNRRPQGICKMKDTYTFLLIQLSPNLWIVNIGLVIPVEAGINRLGQRFALIGFVRGLNALVTNTTGFWMMASVMSVDLS
jgi:hypothetical protein